MGAFIDLVDAKRHLGIDHDEQDDYISSLILAAERQVENITNVVCTERVHSFSIDRFCERIAIPRVPVDAASVSLSYVDTTGATQTIDNEDLRIVEIDGVTYAVAPIGSEWPSTYDAPGAVVVTATVGYADDATGIEALKHVGRLLVGHWFRNRETVVTGTIAAELPQAAKQLMELERVIIP